jgi:hypothetical protein
MNGDATAFYSRLSHKGAACFHFYLLMEITQPCKHWSAALTAGTRREMRERGEEGRWGGCGVQPRLKLKLAAWKLGVRLSWLKRLSQGWNLAIKQNWCY